MRPTWMMLLVCVLAVCGVASAQRAQTPTGGSVVKGRVIYADTGQPLRRAEVSLVTQEGDKWVASTTSDRNGEFVFNNVDAGAYFAIVEAIDIVSPLSPKATRSDSLHLKIALGQIEDGFSEVTVDGHSAAKTEIRASRGGVVTGRVLTESDEPIARAHVTIYRIENGKLRLAALTTRLDDLEKKALETDSRGVYRIAGLATGEYIVRASESDEGGDPDDAADGSYTNGSMMIAFYPKAVRVQDATHVQVQQGSETKDVDIQFTDRIGHRVSGTILMRGKPVSDADIKLTRDEPEEDHDPLELPLARSDDNGRWEIRTIPDGKYTLSVSTSTLGVHISGDYGFTRIARQRRELIVAGEDVTNFNVEVFDEAKVSGVVSVEGGAPMPPTVAVMLNPASKHDEAASDPEDSNRYSIVDKKGEFEIPQLPPGLYQFGFNIPGDYYVKSITLKGRNLLGNPVKIVAGQSLTGIKIVLSADVLSFSGRVVDKNDKTRQLSYASVLLLPVEPERRRIIDGPTVVFSDKDGRFTVKSAPGEYFVFIVDRRTRVPFEMPSEASLVKNASTLQKITLQHGSEKKVVEVVGP